MGNIYTTCFTDSNYKNNTKQIITPSFIINHNPPTKYIYIPDIIENYYRGHYDNDNNNNDNDNDNNV